MFQKKNMAAPVWNEYFDICSFHTNFRSQASIQTLCRFLQETAGNHARNLGVPIESLQSQGMTWMLSRYHLKIHRSPRLWERIKVETWPSQGIGFYVVRDFNMFDAEDQRLASASSIWLIIELARKTPRRIPDYIVDMQVKDRERALYDPFDTIWRPQEVQVEKRFAVRHSDIDANQHVNNVSYVEWAVETIPDTLWQSHEIRELEVSFRAEALAGDVVISQSGQCEEAGQQVVTHRIIRESDHVELFLARTRWMSID